MEEKFCSTDFELQVSVKCFYLALFVEEARNNDQLSNKHFQPQDYSLNTTPPKESRASWKMAVPGLGQEVRLEKIPTPDSKVPTKITSLM